MCIVIHIPASKDKGQYELAYKEVTMFIVVEHTITNPEAFFGLASKVVEKTPSGIKPLQFFPSISKDRAVCLWEANSVEALKGFLGPLTAQSSRDTYYTVDSTKAMGLPTLGSAAASAA
jgi:hypothetical protein